MNRKYSIGIIVIVVLAILLGLASLLGKERVGGLLGNGGSSQTVLVYFLDSANPATTTSCGITRAVPRKVKGDNAPSNALKELFKGPSADEKAEGLTSSFESDDNSGEESLGSYFRGVSIDAGTAYINFDSPALSYLNSPACMQESVKRPIENTLNQFPDIERIEYMIDGAVFTEWDA